LDENDEQKNGKEKQMDEFFSGHGSYVCWKGYFNLDAPFSDIG